MRVAKRSTSFTAPLFLLPSLFVAQVLFYQTVYFQRASWHEDTTLPLVVTKEWRPNQTYSQQIERGVAVLSRSDPGKVAFLRERGIPIHVLTPAQMAVSGCPAGSIGCTRHTDSSINVAAAAAASPVALAVVLSHELTHCRFHDRSLGTTVPSVWSRLLWRNEEAKAHVAGLETARHLGLPLSSGPLAGWWFEYLVWYWPAATLLLSGLTSLFCFHLIAEYIKKRTVQKAAPLSENPVAAGRRGPDLDPQLIWRGKYPAQDEQLVVPALPLYIQEKVNPKAIIDDLRREAGRRKRAEAEAEAPSLFADQYAQFNGLPNEDAKTEFYRHDAHWSNRMILGDSLQVMASLAEREGLRGKVQCIYLDPPYGIKFNSNFQWSTTSRDVKDGNVDHITREPEQVKAFRDTWRDGIHSYLTYLRDRLTVARELLTESGSIFVQIGDENVHRVRAVMDEVFGDENFVSQITVRKTTSEGGLLLGSTLDFILWFARSKAATKSRSLYGNRSDEAEGRYTTRSIDGLVFRLDNITSSRSAGAGDVNQFLWNNALFDPGAGTFKTTLVGMERIGKADRFQITGKGKLSYRRFQKDFSYASIANLWADISGAVQSRSDPKVYVVQTSTSIIQRCLLLTTDPGDLVLDPTCGSGTTAYVAEQWGRRWITIDTSRVALALARARVMGARYPYYLLSDSPEANAGKRSSRKPPPAKL